MEIAERFTKKISVVKQKLFQPSAKKGIAVSSSNQAMNILYFLTIALEIDFSKRENGKVIYTTWITDNMDILNQVFKLFKFSYVQCSGKLFITIFCVIVTSKHYFVVYCERCYSVIGEFPGSLLNGEAPSEAINNSILLVRRSSEVNYGDLVGFHSTS